MQHFWFYGFLRNFNEISQIWYQSTPSSMLKNYKTKKNECKVILLKKNLRKMLLGGVFLSKCSNWSKSRHWAEKIEIFENKLNQFVVLHMRINNWIKKYPKIRWTKKLLRLFDYLGYMQHFWFYGFLRNFYQFSQIWYQSTPSSMLKNYKNK